nr:MAG TPA: hypothetical protein [Caudoviricetes sp.]
MYLWIIDNGGIKRRHQMIIIQKNVSETALFFFTLLIQSLPLVFIFIVMPLLAHIIDIINKKQFVAYSFFF